MFFIYGASFILSWILGGIIWKISNSVNPDCIAEMTTFTGAMQFSVETQMGIGYGHKYLEEDCSGGLIIVMVQQLLGSLLNTFWIGLFFMKMSRPKKRRYTLSFTQKCCIGYKDSSTECQLCFRIGDLTLGHNAQWVNVLCRWHTYYPVIFYIDISYSHGCHGACLFLT